MPLRLIFPQKTKTGAMHGKKKLCSFFASCSTPRRGFSGQRLHWKVIPMGLDISGFAKGTYRGASPPSSFDGPFQIPKCHASKCQPHSYLRHAKMKTHMHDPNPQRRQCLWTHNMHSFTAEAFFRYDTQQEWR